MTTSAPANESHETALISEELGIGAIDAQRVLQLIMEAYLDPEDSILSLRKGAVVSELANVHGYRRIWGVIYSGFLIEVGELWDKRRHLLNIQPYPIN